MADHRITVRVETEGAVARAVLHGFPPFMDVGDTVIYSSPDGTVRVEFNSAVTSLGSIVPGGQQATLTRGGVHFCKCFVTLPGGATIGWSLENPKSGGEHDVRPHPQP